MTLRDGSNPTSQPMRLLIVTRENDEDRAYGLGKTLQPIADALQARGHQVAYFCKSHCAAVHQKWHARFEKCVRPFAPAPAAGIAERLVQGVAAAAQALANQTTHVWVHDPWLAWGIQLGLWRRGIWRRPFKLIVSEHGMGSFAWAVTQDGVPLPDPLYRRLLSAERRTLLQVDAVFSPSHAARDALIRDLGVSSLPAHFHVMGYGRPDITLPCRTEALNHFNIVPSSDCPSRPPVVLAVGRLSPVKRFDLLIEAAALLQTRFQHKVQVVIAGGGDPDALLQQATASGLDPWPIIRFEADISNALAAADIYVGTCAVESYGQANREALAAGTASIVPSAGGSGEVLGLGAKMIPLCAENLAASIAEILQSPEQKQYWQQQAQKESQRWPTWTQLADHYEHTFTTL